MRIEIGRRAGLLAVGLLAAAFSVLPGSGAAEPTPPAAWLGGWSTSPSPPTLAGPSVAGFANQTLREVVSLHFGGPRVRVRLTNAFGAVPLTIGRATVALHGDGASIVPGSVATGPTTFHSLAVTTSYIAPGDRATDAEAAAFDATTTSWFLLDGVDVQANRRADAIVALGD